jgi:hypothetical protein
MNQNYLEFNNWALDYYKYRNSYSTIGTLAIEVIEIENYCIKNSCDLKFPEIIDQNWSKLLLEEDKNKPRYFGLMALQCYAASLMEKDDDNKIRVNDYQKRFIEVSGIKDIPELQNISREKHNNITIQEKIWIEAQKFLKLEKIDISIPKLKNFKNKYIQFPLSQVVLNQEDLKEYYDLFILIERVFEVLSFNDFKIFFKNHKIKCDFKRKNNLKNDRSQNENNIKLKQIFDFYCSENWKVIAESLVTNKISIEVPKYILYYNELAEIKIQLYNDHYDSIVFPKTMFQKSRIKGIVFFKKSDEYANEFDLVNYLENGAEYILVANNDSNLNDLKIIKEYFKCINLNNERLEFFKGKIDENRLPSEFIELINEPYPLKLLGVKISRKKQYLISFPPKIINDKNKDYRVYPEYNINDVKVGVYQIRVPGYSNLNFEIIENPKLKEIIHLKEVGLKISNLNIVKNEYDIQGLHYFENQQIKEESLNINNWIDIQIRKTKIEASNIILKALIQSNYGK